MDRSAAPTTTRFTLQWRGFTIALADSDEERRLAWRIRHDVFLAELLGRQRPDRQERDAFDDHFEQVLVTVTASGEPVGTCRVTSTAVTDRYYSATEFDIAPFLARPGTKIELGRVCLCPAWRNNLALAAIGRAIGHYAQAHGAQWIFGCTSISTIDPAIAAGLTAHFARLGAYDHGCGVMPLPGRRIADLARAGESCASGADDPEALDRLVPPLLRFYLKAGAGLGLEPAVDLEFRCLDFFTMVALRDHRDSPLGRYVRC
jgi:putative hemolysin